MTSKSPTSADVGADKCSRKAQFGAPDGPEQALLFANPDYIQHFCCVWADAEAGMVADVSRPPLDFLGWPSHPFNALLVRQIAMMVTTSFLRARHEDLFLAGADLGTTPHSPSPSRERSDYFASICLQSGEVRVSPGALPAASSPRFRNCIRMWFTFSPRSASDPCVNALARPAPGIDLVLDAVYNVFGKTPSSGMVSDPLLRAEFSRCYGTAALHVPLPSAAENERKETSYPAGAADRPSFDSKLRDIDIEFLLRGRSSAPLRSSAPEESSDSDPSSDSEDSSDGESPASHRYCVVGYSTKSKRNGRFVQKELTRRQAWRAWSSRDSKVLSLYFRAQPTAEALLVGGVGRGLFGTPPFALYRDGVEEDPALDSSCCRKFAKIRLDYRGEVEIFVSRPGSVTYWHQDFQENVTLQLQGFKNWDLQSGEVWQPVMGRAEAEFRGHDDHERNNGGGEGGECGGEGVAGESPHPVWREADEAAHSPKTAAEETTPARRSEEVEGHQGDVCSWRENERKWRLRSGAFGAEKDAERKKGVFGEAERKERLSPADKEASVTRRRVMLSPGDVLYHPSGLWHEVRVVPRVASLPHEALAAAPSITINVSVMPLRWADVVGRALKQDLLLQPQLRSYVHGISCQNSFEKETEKIFRATQKLFGNVGDEGVKNVLRHPRDMFPFSLFPLRQSVTSGQPDPPVRLQQKQDEIRDPYLRVCRQACLVPTTEGSSSFSPPRRPAPESCPTNQATTTAGESRRGGDEEEERTTALRQEEERITYACHVGLGDPPSATCPNNAATTHDSLFRKVLDLDVFGSVNPARGINWLREREVQGDAFRESEVLAAFGYLAGEEVQLEVASSSSSAICQKGGDVFGGERRQEQREAERLGRRGGAEDESRGAEGRRLVQSLCAMGYLYVV